jgi:transcriptional regulator with XRE-family HTH domain
VPAKRAAKGEPKTRQHTENPRFRREIDRIARRVRALRLERGWTVEEASERMRIEPMSLRRIESRRANPTLGTLVSVAAAFRLSLVELLHGADSDASE